MNRNLLFRTLFLASLILFSACTPQANRVFHYTINTNVQDTQIWCGTSKNNLEYCYSAPYDQYSATSKS